jgi:hypothetical protein
MKRKALQPVDLNIHRSALVVEQKVSKRKMAKKSARHELEIATFMDTYFKDNTDVRATCDTASENDPPLIFAWRNVQTFVDAIPHVHLAPPFALPQNPSVEEFKTALLNFARFPGSQFPQSMAILPCTITEITNVCGKLAKLEDNPWFVAVAAYNPLAVPIASLVTPHPRKSFVGLAYSSPPDAGCLLWGEL